MGILSSKTLNVLSCQFFGFHEFQISKGTRISIPRILIFAYLENPWNAKDRGISWVPRHWMYRLANFLVPTNSRFREEFSIQPCQNIEVLLPPGENLVIRLRQSSSRFFWDLFFLLELFSFFCCVGFVTFVFVKDSAGPFRFRRIRKHRVPDTWTLAFLKCEPYVSGYVSDEGNELQIHQQQLIHPSPARGPSKFCPHSKGPNRLRKEDAQAPIQVHNIF